jgi:hypothetical protein
MPVNVDTVYQTVQALANKEQRGYLTPQEFNLFANQAQQDMFEQYFYDLNAFRKQGDQERAIGDSVTYIQHKIKNTNGVSINNATPCSYQGNGIWTLPTGKLTGRIFYIENNNRRELKILPGHVEDLLKLKASKWHKTSDEAYYFEDGWARIQAHKIIAPISTGITCERVNGKPGLVYWGYVVINEKPVYDSGSSKDFDLDSSEQTDLVMTILKLAGISIEDPTLYQAASQEEQQNMQLENK